MRSDRHWIAKKKADRANSKAKKLSVVMPVNASSSY